MLATGSAIFTLSGPFIPQSAMEIVVYLIPLLWNCVIVKKVLNAHMVDFNFVQRCCL